MVERRRPGRVAGALAAGALLAACAAAPPPAPDPALPMREAQAELEHASPAARDALAEGLRWIVLDAPGSSAPRAAPATAAERLAETPDEPPATAPDPPPAVTAVAAPATRPEPERYRTRTWLNLRTGPGLDQAVLVVLRPGVEIAAREVSGDWVRTTTARGLEGWLHRDWLEPIGPAGGRQPADDRRTAERITSEGVEP